MKNLQILIMCCFLVLLTACGREDGGTAQNPCCFRGDHREYHANAG